MFLHIYLPALTKVKCFSDVTVTFACKYSEYVKCVQCECCNQPSSIQAIKDSPPRFYKKEHFCPEVPRKGFTTGRTSKKR